MLGQRRRRWANINLTLSQPFVFAGNSFFYVCTRAFLVTTILSCKAIRQYQLTLQVSRYCPLALQSSRPFSDPQRLHLALTFDPRRRSPYTVAARTGYITHKAQSLPNKHVVLMLGQCRRRWSSIKTTCVLGSDWALFAGYFAWSTRGLTPPWVDPTGRDFYSRIGFHLLWNCARTLGGGGGWSIRLAAVEWLGLANYNTGHADRSRDPFRRRPYRPCIKTGANRGTQMQLNADFCPVCGICKTSESNPYPASEDKLTWSDLNCQWIPALVWYIYGTQSLSHISSIPLRCHYCDLFVPRHIIDP